MQRGRTPGLRTQLPTESKIILMPWEFILWTKKRLQSLSRFVATCFTTDMGTDIMTADFEMKEK